MQDLVQKGSKPSRKAAAGSANKARPVDQSQASRGKLDYVKVNICILVNPKDKPRLMLMEYSVDNLHQVGQGLGKR